MTIITVPIPRSTAFDDTVPTTVAMGDSAATGSAVTAARRDHLHQVFSVAHQDEMEAATTSTVPVGPAVVRYAPGVAKAWILNNSPGTSILASTNIASLGDTGTGNRDVNFTTAFSSVNYVSLPVITSAAVTGDYVETTGRTTADANIRIFDASDTAKDLGNAVGFFGDQ